MASLLYHWDFTSSVTINDALNTTILDDISGLEAKVISRNAQTDSQYNNASRNSDGIYLNNGDICGGICIDLSGLDDVNLGGNISIEMVIKNDDLSRNSLYFQTIQGPDVSNNKSAFITFKYHGTIQKQRSTDDQTKLLVRTDAASIAPQRKVLIDHSLNTTSFFHYVCTVFYSTSGSRIRLFIDGNQEGENTDNLNRSLNDTIRQSNLIGTQKNPINAPYFKGTIQYLKIYQGELSSTEVSNAYNSFVNGNLNTGNICFLGSEKVQTDQGKIRFDELTISNTIQQCYIKRVLKMMNADNTLIFIRKNALGKKIPSTNMYISRNHGIYLDNIFIVQHGLPFYVHESMCIIRGKNLVRARDLVCLKNVEEVIRDKRDIIYNLLFDTHRTMIVNGLICETLSPINKYARA